MNNRKIIAYAIIVLLIAVFGLSAWLASDSRFIEAISLVGVATTFGWFATRMIPPPDED